MLLEFGRFGRAHGVRGELRFQPYNPQSPLLKAGRTIRVGRGPEQTDGFRVERLRFDAKGVVMKLDGIDDRDAAGRLTHQKWFEDRADFPRARPDEIYVVDLIGLEARTADGRLLGTIVHVLELGPHDVLVIRGQGRQHLIPNVPAFVREMDFDEKRVTITPIEGLLSEEDS